MRKFQIVALLLSFLAVSGLCFATGHQEVLMTKERQLWKAFKNKDVKAFGQWIAEDLEDISSPGVIRTKADVIKMMSEIEMTEYQLTDMKVSDVTKDVAIVTYKVKAKGTHNGKPMPDAQYVVSTVWVNKNGDWWVRFHQESPIMPEPK